MTKLLYTFLVCLCLAAAAVAQSDVPASPAVEEAYLARDNGAGKAGEQAIEFRTTDVPIYCVILLDSSAKAVVKMNFVAVKVPGVKPETKVVTAAYTTREGQNRVNFTGVPDGEWVAGKYRVDVFIDGKLARNLEFDIKGSVAASKNLTEAKFVETPPRPAKPRPRKP